MDLETFAAERIAELDSYVEMYLPAIEDALYESSESQVHEALILALLAGYTVAYEDQAGRPPTPPELASFRSDMEPTIRRLIVDRENADVQAQRVASWFATAAYGKAVYANADRGSTKTWVTMLDAAVRDTHAELHGESRDLTDTFTVNTTPPAIMQYPGQPVGPPAAWINCRCVLGINIASNALTAGGHDLSRLAPTASLVHLTSAGTTPSGAVATDAPVIMTSLAVAGADGLRARVITAKDVLALRDGVEVFGVHAVADAAEVVDDALWLGAVSEFPSDSVRQTLLANGVVPDAAVAVVVEAPVEQPAPLGDLGEVGHAFSERSGFRSSDSHVLTLAQHDLVFLENRRTPAVVSKGAKYEPKPFEGRIVRRRAATAEEEKTIANGDWVRVNQSGKKPGDPDYMKKKSKVRPQHNSLEAAMDDELDDEVMTPEPVSDRVPPGDGEDEVPDEAYDAVEEDMPVFGILAPEGVESGDGRSFSIGGLEWRDLPLPLKWQRVDADGHETSVIVGRIDTITRNEFNELPFTGTLFADIPETEEVILLMAQGALRGVSVDVDRATLKSQTESDGTAMPKSEFAGRVSAATIVAIPAFAEAFIALGLLPDDEELISLDEPPTPSDQDLSDESGDDLAFREFPTARRKEDAKKGLALPDGSFPIENVEDLRNAIQAIGRAKDPAKAKAHIKKRARALGHPELIPDDWAADTAEFKRGPGWITDPEETRRIHAYWTRGKGALKIRWGTGGDFTRCTRNLRKYINPLYLNRTCAEWHHDALGYWPGTANMPGNPTTAEIRARRKKKLSLETACQECEDQPMIDTDPAAMFSVTAAAPAPNRPHEWFQNPNLSGPTALEVTREGRVYGHLAAFGVCHIGIDHTCVEAPRSATDYAYFKRGSVFTDQGEIPTGVITLNTGHADLDCDFSSTVSHYDHTGTGVADVAIGEDDHGIWIAGAVRDGITEEQVRTLKASGAISGDWRMIGGSLELVAGLAVNVPGFPVPRTALAASADRTTALVAANVIEGATEGLDVEAFATAVVAAIEAREARKDRIAKIAPVAAEARAERVAKLLASID